MDYATAVSGATTMVAASGMEWRRKVKGDLSITVNALMSVPDETARRCMTLLEMWWDDNPDKNIVCSAIPCDDGIRHRFWIQTLESEVKE